MLVAGSGEGCTVTLMARTRGTAVRPHSALDGLVSEGDAVLLLGLDELGEDAWAVLVASGLRLLRAAETDEAVRLIAEGEAPVVLTDVRRGPALIHAVRARPALAAVHVVVCADLDSPQELREALDSGADDVMRIPFEPQVLAVRVATGLRAARLRANEAMLCSLVDSIPGTCPSGCRWRSRRRRTSWSRRRSPTSRGTPRRATPPSASTSATGSSW
jgi:CheY-like chemotaxis protein